MLVLSNCRRYFSACHSYPHNSASQLDMHLPQLSVLETLMFALQCQIGPKCEHFNIANHIERTVREADLAAEAAGYKLHVDNADQKRFLELLREVKDARGLQVRTLYREGGGEGGALPVWAIAERPPGCTMNSKFSNTIG